MRQGGFLLLYLFVHLLFTAVAAILLKLDFALHKLLILARPIVDFLALGAREFY
jgi:hypothetical protein